MIRYGKNKCDHKWRYRKDGWEEGCIPAICLKCGAFGCVCDYEKSTIPAGIFFDEGERGHANINGKWINPYVKKKGDLNGRA